MSRISTEHFRTPAQPTPFDARTRPLCQTESRARWAGFSTVSVYRDVGLEYAAVRNRAGVFDLSPMVKYDITGPDATAYLDRLVTRDLSRLVPGRVTYVVWCEDGGRVLDDGTLFRFDEQRFRLCCQDRHLPWLLDAAIGYDVRVQDVSETVAALAIQGPMSCSMLLRAGFTGLDKLRPFDVATFTVDGLDLQISRTGFTGDLGYELWVGADEALKLWDRVWDAAAPHGLTPFGSAALDLLRIEAGFLQPHADFMPFREASRIDRGRSPFELGLDWLVSFDKGFFIGRRALEREKQAGSRYRLVGLDVPGNKPATDSFIYRRRRKEVGHVTSAMWSPTCKRNIALAIVDARALEGGEDDLWAEIYVPRELQWEKRMVQVRIVPRPFFDPSRRKATPPADF
jgi:aminomethyltransferase